MKNAFATASSILILLTALYSCGGSRKIADVMEKGLRASIAPITDDHAGPVLDFGSGEEDGGLEVEGPDGRTVMIMKAVRDEESGEMIATDELGAAFVAARFRNVAERHGMVMLDFSISVPQEMLDPSWQIRFHPELRIQSDTLMLEDINITGHAYREAQLKGYQHYERFISRIIQDSSEFVDLRHLEIFLRRNMPEIYVFRTDSAYVSDEEFISRSGISGKEAADHYTDHFAARMNEKRKSRRQLMWARYIKAPMVTENVRLDTVIRSFDNMVTYNYSQALDTKDYRGVRKAGITLKGEICRQEKIIYRIPCSDEITFYISSLSGLLDESERFLTKVIRRNVEVHHRWRIEFKAGSSTIESERGENAHSLEAIRNTLSDLVCNELFVMDSAVVTASASPEGKASDNRRLSERRAESAAGYALSCVETAADSLQAERGIQLSFDGSAIAGNAEERKSIEIRSVSGGENWKYLDLLVEKDSILSDRQKQAYFKSASERNADLRESILTKEDFYPYIREQLYPELRAVEFVFHLHRKDMVKDTIHTSVLDSTYMKALQLAKDSEYEMAADILGPRMDYNAAVVMVALDRNHQAAMILDSIRETAPACYLKAIVSARLGDAKAAVTSYLKACRMDPSFIHRGNLDPEIASLKRGCDLFRIDL